MLCKNVLPNFFVVGEEGVLPSGALYGARDITSPSYKRLGFMCLSDTSTLAYYSGVVFTSYNTLFSLLATNVPSNLDCLFLWGFSSLVECLLVRRTITRVEHLAHKGRKSLPGTNTLAYCTHSWVTKKIKCCQLDPDYSYKSFMRVAWPG